MKGWSGLFGKLPETGDFVARGLPAGVRRDLDRWVTARLAADRDAPWPEGGLRGLVRLSGGPALVVAVPSRDIAERRFPLVAAIDGTGLAFEVAEIWCDLVHPALTAAASGLAAVADLEAAIAAIDEPPRVAEDGEQAVWRRGGPPMATEDGDLLRLVSSG